MVLELSYDGLTTDELLQEFRNAYRSQELLRLAFNENGAKYKNQEMTATDWTKYKRDVFKPNSRTISKKIGDVRNEIQSRTEYELPDLVADATPSILGRIRSLFGGNGVNTQKITTITFPDSINNESEVKNKKEKMIHYILLLSLIVDEDTHPELFDEVHSTMFNLKKDFKEDK